MEQNVFEEKFADWENLPDTDEGEIYAKFIWNDVGNHPTDHRFTVLSELYLAGDSEQRRFIENYFEGKEKPLYELSIYTRRVAKLIEAETDTRWLQLGLAAAAIGQGRTDFRDWIVAMVVLRYGAERVGIETSPYFDEIIEIADPETHSIFLNVRDHPDSAIKSTIEYFGPGDWVPEVRPIPQTDESEVISGMPFEKPSSWWKFWRNK